MLWLILAETHLDIPFVSDSLSQFRDILPIGKVVEQMLRVYALTCQRHKFERENDSPSCTARSLFDLASDPRTQERDTT